jgi:hypothetical protein
MNNSHILIITPELNQIEAIKKIKEKKESIQETLIVDFTRASFPLSRDVFLVLSKRFHKDDISLIVSEESHRVLAKSF